MRFFYQLFAFTLLFLISCQDDTLIDRQTDDLQKRAFTSLDREDNLVKALDNVTLISINGRVKSGLAEFKQDSILKVLQPDSVSYSYTFASSENYSGQAFRNLVIRQVNGGYVGFILEYVPDEFKSLLDLEHFTGTIRRYDLHNNLLIEIKLTNGLSVRETLNGRVNSCANSFYLSYESFDGISCTDLWDGNTDGCEPYIYITSCGGDAASGGSDFWTPPGIDEGTYFPGGPDTNGTGGGDGNNTAYPETYRVLATQVPSLSGEAFDNYVALEAWENDQILDGQLKPCMQTILGSIKQLSNGSVGQIIQKFSGAIPGYNWEVKDGSLPGYENAATSTNYNTITGTVTTTFDANKMTNATNLSIARTIIHESIHSYIVAVTYNTLTDPVQRQTLLGPDWASAFLNYGHDYIISNYLTPIADALEQYGINKGYSLPRQFYEDLAWGGLTDQTKRDSQGNIIKDGLGNTLYEETPLFNSIVPSATDRSRIKGVVDTELGSTNQTNQKGHAAGC